MIDKNGIELEIGDTVTDGHGITGKMVNISGHHMVKFEFNGEDRYTPLDKIVGNQIEKVVA